MFLGIHGWTFLIGLLRDFALGLVVETGSFFLGLFPKYVKFSFEITPCSLGLTLALGCSSLQTSIGELQQKNSQSCSFILSHIQLNSKTYTLL
jgi:hypothetical protein